MTPCRENKPERYRLLLIEQLALWFCVPEARSDSCLTLVNASSEAARAFLAFLSLEQLFSAWLHRGGAQQLSRLLLKDS